MRCRVGCSGPGRNVLTRPADSFLELAATFRPPRASVPDMTRAVGERHERSQPSTTFEALFSREQKQMLRLAILLVDDRAAAEDIVQEAFAAVAARWDSIEVPGAYLRTSVVNGSRLVLRQRRTERRRDERMRTDASSRASVPVELVELDAALGALSIRKREALTLRYFDELPLGEVAAVMRCKPSTVRSLVRRGLRDLRKELP